MQEDGVHRRQWLLPHAAIAVESAAHTAQPASPPQPPISVTAFNVGDAVAFTDKYLRERVGTVTRLNDKTVSVLCDGERWRVTRRILRKIIDV